MEYETQFRIEQNDVSSALWKRRDAILDDNPIGGGMATPIADGIVALQIEAFDGLSWFPQWDSDETGIPHAIRVSVSSTGMDYVDESYAPIVTLRTIVPLDRVRSPDDKLVLIAEVEEEARLAALGIEPEGEVGFGLDTAGSSGSSSSSGSGSGSGSSGGKPSSGDTSGTASRPGTGTTITDPDGNVHDIPPDP